MQDFNYVNIMDVDPTFQNIEPGVYDLQVSKAERKTYTDKKTGAEKSFVKFTFTVTNSPRFAGRKIFESLFYSNFSLVCLRRVADATGIAQHGSMDEWLAELSTAKPLVRLKVDEVDDGKTMKNEDGSTYFVPNAQTVKPDGTPGKVNRIDWRAGVQVAQ